MRRPRLRYIIMPDDSPEMTRELWDKAFLASGGIRYRGTKKSALRLAQKYADMSGVPFMFGVKKQLHRTFVVRPRLSEYFIHQI